MRRHIEDEAFGQDIASEIENLARPQMRADSRLGTGDLSPWMRFTPGPQGTVWFRQRTHDMTLASHADSTANRESVTYLG